MQSFVQSVKKFLASEDGPTAVEYAVMLALIVIVCLAAIQAIGNNANTKFGAVRDALTESARSAWRVSRIRRAGLARVLSWSGTGSLRVSGLVL
jgi:pilus assembly protein Flp/PilA